MVLLQLRIGDVRPYALLANRAAAIIGGIGIKCFICICSISCFFKRKTTKKGGQEVDYNPKNCALIQYIRGPPDPAGSGVCFTSQY